MNRVGMVLSMAGLLILTGSGRLAAGWELLHLELGDGNALIDISMPDERTICAVGVWQPGGSGSNSAPLIVCSANSGQTWVKPSLGGTMNLPLAVHLVDASVGYLASMSIEVFRAYAKVYRTENSGESWTEQPLPGSPQGMFSDIFFLDRNVGCAVGGKLSFCTSDGGTNWTASSLPALAGERSLYGVFVLDATRVWAVGGVPGTEGDEFNPPLPPSDGFILRSDDGGRSFQMAAENFAGALNRVWFGDGQHGWAVGGGPAGLILHTPNGGTGWEPQAVPAGVGGAADYVSDVVFVDRQNGYAVGNIGQGNPMVLTTKDGGGSWVVDLTYDQAFDQLTGMEKLAKWSMLAALSFPLKGRGAVCGKNAVVVGYSGEGFCPDADADGHLAERCGGDDCDDGNAYLNPGAAELCNRLDENCNGIADDGFDLLRDPRNCGECGFNCQPAQVCWDGKCVLNCPAGLTRCGQECADLSSDPKHCSGCDQPCSYPNAQGVCNGGSCQMGDCLAGFVNLDRQNENGCEYPCTLTGAEACDGLDNDCDGEIDEGLSHCQVGPDGGVPDGGILDGGGDGCSCRVQPGLALGSIGILLVGLLVRGRRKS